MELRSVQIKKIKMNIEQLTPEQMQKVIEEDYLNEAICKVQDMNNKKETKQLEQKLKAVILKAVKDIIKSDSFLSAELQLGNIIIIQRINTTKLYLAEQQPEHTVLEIPCIKITENVFKGTTSGRDSHRNKISTKLKKTGFAYLDCGEYSGVYVLTSSTMIKLLTP